MSTSQHPLRVREGSHTPADPAEDEARDEEEPSGPNPRAPSTSEPHPPDHDDVKPLKGDG